MVLARGGYLHRLRRYHLREDLAFLHEPPDILELREAMTSGGMLLAWPNICCIFRA